MSNTNHFDVIIIGTGAGGGTLAYKLAPSGKRILLLERRVRPSVKDFTVYRNRLQIDHPAHLGHFAFKPYVADEVWHSTQTGARGEFGWFRNRISVGLIKQLTEHLSGDFFVLYQSDGLSRPGNIPVVGTLFRYTL